MRSVQESAGTLGVLDTLVVSPEWAVRRACLELMANDSSRHAVVVGHASGDPNPKVRQWLAREVGRDAIQAADSCIRAMLNDSVASVSDALVQQLSVDRVHRFEDELLRRSVSENRRLRALARAALRRSSPESIRDRARDLVIRNLGRAVAGDAAIRPEWVAALGEVGRPEDGARVEPFLSHSRGAVRGEAVIAMGRLVGSQENLDAQELARMLDDPSGRVRRAVSIRLAKVPEVLWASTARNVLEMGSEAGRIAAMRLLSRRGGWRSVPVLLAGLGSGLEAVESIALARLDQWSVRHVSRRWLAIDPKEWDELKRAWSRLQNSTAAAGRLNEACPELCDWIREQLSTGTSVHRSESLH
ncbi:MAG: HEAT repeat domain-containing protein [Phycisphaerales bacterium]